MLKYHLEIHPWLELQTGCQKVEEGWNGTLCIKENKRKQNSRKQEQSGKLNLFSAQEEILSSKVFRAVSSIYEWFIYISKKLNKMTKTLRAKCQGVRYTSEKDSINSCVQEFKIRQKLIRIMNRYITIWQNGIMCHIKNKYKIIL